MIKIAIFLLLAGCAAASPAGGHRRRGPPKCGLPSFTDRLPEETQAELKKIWENYEDGKGCDEEHEKTKEVLDKLPAEVRRKALRRGPAFLNGASDEVRAQFDALWKNHTIPRDEKPEKFKELAEKLLNAEQLKEFNKFHAALQKRREEFQKKLKELSPEALAAHEKLAKLREERHKIFMDASESVREELMKLYHSDRRKYRHDLD